MAGLRCLRFSAPSVWTCHFLFRRSSSLEGEMAWNGEGAPDPRSSHQGRQKQEWQNSVPSPPQWWWDHRLGKSQRTSGHRHFGIRGDLCVNDNRYRASGVNVHVGQSGLEGPQVSPWCGTTTSEAKLLSLCKEGQLEKALDVLLLMDQLGLNPTLCMYKSFLQACSKRKALAQTKRIQAHLAQRGLQSSRSLGEHIVITLVKCGAVHDALKVFHSLPFRTAFSWTALISGYTLSGQGQEALRMYLFMREQGVEPNNYTFVSLLKACSSIGDLEEGKRIHREAIKFNYEADLFVRTCLVDMYGKHGHIEDARDVFDAFPERNVALWNAMMAAYAHQGQPENALKLYGEMEDEGVSSDAWTFVSALQACGMLAEKEETGFADGQCIKEESLEFGKRLHIQTQRKGCNLNVFVSNTLVSMYGKCGSIVDAQNVFDQLSSQRNVVSWNALLAVYAQQGQSEKALQLYEQMLEEGVAPNDRTRNTLVTVYGNCGNLVDAQNMFDGLLHRDLVSWNAMLMVYAEQGEEEKALKLYERMKEEGVSADAWTFVSVLQAYSMLADNNKWDALNGLSIKAGSLGKGKALHADARRKGYDSNVYVCNTLIRLYGKCGSTMDAENVFGSLSQPSVVSCNALLSVHAQQGQGDKALQLYVQMREEGVSADAWTFVTALQSCGMLAEKDEDAVVNGESTKLTFLEKGQAIHAYAQSKGFSSNEFLGSTLVSMYAKCGSVVDAQIVFDALSQQNVFEWTAMLAAYVEQGKGEKVLQMYQQMIEEGVSPDAWTFVSVLQACSLLVEKGKNDDSVDGDSMDIGLVAKGKALHAMAAEMGYDSSAFVGNALLTLYGKCGSIVDAQNIFDSLSQPDGVSWNSMLAAYAEQGQTDKALQLYEQMQWGDVSPTVRTFISMFQACGTLSETEDAVNVNGLCTKVNSLATGKEIHAFAQQKGHNSDVFIGSALIGMYGKCGSMVDAQNVFDGLWQRDVVFWNVMLGAFGEQGQGEQVLHLYGKMREEGASPDVWTFVSTLQACGMVAECEEDCGTDGHATKFKVLERGKAMHAETERYGYSVDVFVGNTLVSMYGKCGSIVDAQNVFDRLLERDVVSWNVMLAAYVEGNQGEEALWLYNQMRVEGMSPDVRTFGTLLQACCRLAEQEGVVISDDPCRKVMSLGRCKAVHAEARRNVYDRDLFVSGTLVSLYGKCGSIVDARNVFDLLSPGDVMLWNAMLTAYAEGWQAEEALQLYEHMVEQGVSPDVRTFVSVLQACGMLVVESGADVVNGVAIKIEPLRKGKAVHADAQGKGYSFDVYVGSTLIRMYGKCGSTADGRAVFDGLPKLDVVPWNAMLAAYVGKGQTHEAFQLYQQMWEEGVVSPDAWTFVSILQACGILAEREEYVTVVGQSLKAESMEKGKAIHGDARRTGWDSDTFVGNTLVSTYGKCGSIADARDVFDRLSQRDVVSWNAMLVAYVEQGQGETALNLYQQMQQEGVSSNDITLVCILQACCNTGSLHILRQMHQSIVSRGHVLSPFLASSLISAYGRCASMSDARSVFDTQPQPDGVSWNALIAGYARQGDCAQASLQCFQEMQLAGMKPDGVTFLSLLSACSHAGLVDRGLELFESMSRDHHLTPGVEHYVSMVDLFARAGCFGRVEELLSTMPMQPNLAMWLCLMGACQKHGEVALGEAAFQHAVRIQPKHPAPYLLMSNIYADAGLLEPATEVKKSRQREGAWKQPGQSWIEHEQHVHSFLVEERTHAQLLYDLLGTLNKR